MGAVHAEHVVGDAAAVFGHPSEQAHRAAAGAGGELMGAGLEAKGIDAGAGVAGGGDGFDDRPVIGDFHDAAARLAEEVEFGRGAIGFEGDELAGAAGGHGDAGQAIHAVAVAGDEAVRVPEAGGGGFDIEAAIAEIGTAGVGKAGPAVAEAGLEKIAGGAGPIVGGGMGVAVVQDGEDLLAGSAVEAHQLFEKGDERGGIFDGAGLIQPLGDGGAGGEAHLRADRRGAGDRGPAAGGPGGSPSDGPLHDGGFLFGDRFPGAGSSGTHATRQGEEQRCGDEKSIQRFSSPG